MLDVSSMKSSEGIPSSASLCERRKKIVGYKLGDELEELALPFRWDNLLMVAWIISYFVQIGEVITTTADEYEQAGAAIGGTLGTGFILIFWVIGNIILGIPTLLTRPSK